MKQKYQKKHIFFLALVVCAVFIILVGSVYKKSHSSAGDTDTSQAMIIEETKSDDMTDHPVQEPIQVLTVDGQGIYMTEVSVRMYQLRDYYTGLYGESPWANTLDDGRTVSETAKDELYQSLIRTQVLCNQAAAYDLGLSETEIQTCAEEAQHYIDELGPQICQSFNVTFDGALAVSQKQLLAAKVYEQVMNELGGDTNATEQTGEDTYLKYEALYEQWLKDSIITEMPAWQNVVIGSVG